MSTKSGLSSIKDTYCPDCNIEIHLNLSVRRGDEDFVCGSCGEIHTIREIEKYVESLSPIVEGDCPNCETRVELGISARSPGVGIKCPECSEIFYIDELEHPSNVTGQKRQGRENMAIKKEESTDVASEVVAGSTDSIKSKQGLFKGRLNRKNFIVGFLLNIVIGWSLAFFLGYFLLDLGVLLSYPLAFVIAFFNISFGIRRLHDTNLTGWFMLFIFIPMANLILLIYLIVSPSVEPGNKYGELVDVDVNIKRLYGLD